jgi:hypothetical protein
VLIGRPVHNKIVGAFANGWEVSGITTIQSGPDIPTTTSNPGFAASGNIGQQNLTNGSANPKYITISNAVYLGTPDVSLQPALTCNPAQGLNTTVVDSDNLSLLWQKFSFVGYGEAIIGLET